MYTQDPCQESPVIRNPKPNNSLQNSAPMNREGQEANKSGQGTQIVVTRDNYLDKSGNSSLLPSGK
jgi:hypothetical protein